MLNNDEPTARSNSTRQLARCLTGVAAGALIAVGGWAAVTHDANPTTVGTSTPTTTAQESRPSRLLPMQDADDLVDEAFNRSRQATTDGCDNTPITVAAPIPDGWTTTARTIAGVTLTVPHPEDWVIEEVDGGFIVASPDGTAWVELGVYGEGDFATWTEIADALKDRYLPLSPYKRTLTGTTPVVQDGLVGCSFAFELSDGEIDAAVLDGDTFAVLISSGATADAVDEQQQAQWAAMATTISRAQS